MAFRKDPKPADEAPPAPEVTLSTREAFDAFEQMATRLRVFEQIGAVLKAALEAEGQLVGLRRDIDAAQATLSTLAEAHVAAEATHGAKIEALTQDAMAKATAQTEKARALIETLTADVTAAQTRKRDALAAADAAEQGAKVRIERAEAAALEAEGKAAKIQETLAGLKAQIGA